MCLLHKTTPENIFLLQIVNEQKGENYSHILNERYGLKRLYISTRYYVSSEQIEQSCATREYPLLVERTQRSISLIRGLKSYATVIVSILIRYEWGI